MFTIKRNQHCAKGPPASGGNLTGGNYSADAAKCILSLHPNQSWKRSSDAKAVGCYCLEPAMIRMPEGRKDCWEYAETICYTTQLALFKTSLFDRIASPGPNPNIQRL